MPKATIELTDWKLEDKPFNESFASNGEVDLKDLKFVSYILCTEGPNRNRDFWLREVIEKAAESCIHKPININHDRDFTDAPMFLIGHNIGYELGEWNTQAGTRFGIKAHAVLYDYLLKNTEHYRNLMLMLEDNTLRASMEVLFTDYKIVDENGNTIEVEKDPFLDTFFSREGMYRAFWGEVVFFGSAFLLGIPPADPHAEVYDEDEEGDSMDDSESSEASIEDEFLFEEDYIYFDRLLRKAEVSERNYDRLTYLQELKEVLVEFGEEIQILPYQTISCNFEKS